MDRNLIDREVLKEKLTPIKLYGGVYCKAITEKDIDDAPTVEAYPFEQVQELVKLNQQFAQEIENLKRPQGEWITRHKQNKLGQDVVCFECSKCGECRVPLYHLLITEPLKVCPNCGADMRKGGVE